MKEADGSGGTIKEDVFGSQAVVAVNDRGLFGQSKAWRGVFEIFR